MALKLGRKVDVTNDGSVCAHDKVPVCRRQRIHTSCNSRLFVFQIERRSWDVLTHLTWDIARAIFSSTFLTSDPYLPSRFSRLREADDFFWNVWIPARIDNWNFVAANDQKCLWQTPSKIDGSQQDGWCSHVNFVGYPVHLWPSQLVGFTYKTS